MASADVAPPSDVTPAFDVPRIAAFLQVTPQTVEALSAIEGAVVANVLTALTEKAREHAELVADKLKADVELEQNARTANARVASAKKQLATAHSETQELRKKLSEAETAKAHLEADLANLKNNSTSNDEKARTLRARVTTLEAEKREVWEAFERKNNSYDRLQEDYQQVQTKLIETRKETNNLESRLQQAESEKSSSKFRETKLKQELEIAKKNSEWLDGEFNAKTAELSKFRKEKNAQVSKLQHEFEEERSRANMAERNADVIKSHYEEVSRKLTETQRKVQDLNEKVSNQEEGFRTEMSSSKRLAELWEQSANSARERVKQVEEIMNNERGKQAEELGRIQTMCESLREESAHAASRVEELEVANQRLEGDLAVYANAPALSRQESPGFGRRSMNGPMTPQRERSVTPGGARFGTPGALGMTPAGRNGMSVSQMYQDWQVMKRELESANTRNARLQESFDELIQELEGKVPEFDQQKEDLDRATNEVLGMSELLAEANKAKDHSSREASGLRRKVKEQTAEMKGLKQQLRDVSAQVQFLLSEVEHLSSGLPPLGTAEQARFKKLALQSQSLSIVTSDTDRIINQRLVLFSNVKQLQETNNELLKVVRQLGSKMEEDEERTRQEAEGQKTREVLELSQTLEMYQDEIKGLQQRAESFIKERDMFRRMLQNRGDIPRQQDHPEPVADVSMLGASQMVVHDQEANSRNEEFAQLYKQVQQNFDAFRQEALTDHNTLRDQANALQAEKNDLQIQITRVNGQIELANSRYEMLNNNYDMLKSENSELQKRNQNLSESQAKLDFRSQQVEEELMDTKSLIESMRSENSHLKAEKQLFKSVEDRLSRDNENLLDERSKLNATIASVQGMLNERDRSEGEARRRSDQQINNLEGELQATKRRLNDEIEESKKASIRRDLEAKEAQGKIDKVNADLAKAREDLVAAQTTRDLQQSRVEELQILLKASEDKLALFKPAESTGPINQEDSNSVEQDLRIEITELTRKLEIAQADEQAARIDKDVYFHISQDSEVSLNHLTETYEAYKEDTDRQIEQSEARIKDLEQRMADITSEMDATNAEVTRLRQEDAEHKNVLEEQEKTHTDKLTSLQAEIDSLVHARTEASTMVKRQADIAKDAQHNYEQELMKHAQAAEALQKIRSEYTELKNQVYGFQAASEYAKTTLESSTSSWELQKNTYEKELNEVRARCDDLVKQNKLLHTQFEGVSLQIASLQKYREQADGELEIANSDKSLEELREVIAYLRREKEIVDVQLELQTQESRRFKTQLDHARTQVDEVRTQLQEERMRENETLRSVAQHEDLIQRISELNLLRESNSALRTEKDRLAKKLVETQEKVSALTVRVEPMEDKISDLEGQVLVKDGQIKLLEEDNERWKTRTNQILSKYDRIDPVELENLKADLKAMTDRYDMQLAQLTEKDATIAEKTKALEGVNEKYSALVAKSNSNVRDGKERIAAVRDKLKEREATIEQLKIEMTELRNLLDNANSDKAGLQAQAAIAPISMNSSSFDEERGRLESQIYALEEKYGNLETEQNARVEALIQENNNIKSLLAEAQQQVTALQNHLAALPTNGQMPVVEAIVAQRVAEHIAIQPENGVQDLAVIQAAVDQALAVQNEDFTQQRQKLKDQYNAALRKRLEEVKESKTKEVAAKQEIIMGLEAQIAQLQAAGGAPSGSGDAAKDAEIQSLRQAKTEAEAQIEQLRSVVSTETPDVAAKDEEIEALKQAKAAADAQIEQLRCSVAGDGVASATESELQAQLASAIQRAAELEEQYAQSQTELAETQKKVRSNEDMQRIISKNVQARLPKEKEKWEKEQAEVFAAKEQKFQEDLVSQIEQQKTIQAAALQAAFDEEKKAREEAYKAELVTAKEQAAKMGEMKGNVKFSQLKRKADQLEAKVRELGGEIEIPVIKPQQIAPAAAPPPQAPVTSTSSTQPSAAANPFAAAAQTLQQPKPIMSAFQPQQPTLVPNVSAFAPKQQQTATPTAFAAPTPATPAQWAEAEAKAQYGSIGTGPAALRSLRGGMQQTGIPKPGGAGRGGNKVNQPSGIPTPAAGAVVGVPLEVIAARQARFGPTGAGGQQLQQPNVQIQGAQNATRGGRGGNRGGANNNRQSIAGQGNSNQVNTNIPTFGNVQIPIIPVASTLPAPAFNPNAQQFTPSGGQPTPIIGKRERNDEAVNDDTKRQRTPNHESNGSS